MVYFDSKHENKLFLIFLTQPNQPKQTCGRPYPIGRALSELRISALPYWTNTFGAIFALTEMSEGTFGAILALT